MILPELDLRSGKKSRVLSINPPWISKKDNIVIGIEAAMPPLSIYRLPAIDLSLSAIDKIPKLTYGLLQPTTIINRSENEPAI